MRHPMCACEAYYDEHHPECPVRQHVESLRSETARLRALLEDERREADALRSERDDRRKSLAQEIRQTLTARGLYAPKDDRPESDLIGAVGLALDSIRALLDERTALLRETNIDRLAWMSAATSAHRKTCERVPCRYCNPVGDDNSDDLSRRIAATLKETTCDS